VSTPVQIPAAFAIFNVARFRLNCMQIDARGPYNHPRIEF
jgi:hypothetical protein